MKTVYNTTSAEIIASLNNPATSYWLKDALETSLKRDPIDALMDVSILQEILKKRADELQQYYVCVEDGKLVAHNDK